MRTALYTHRSYIIRYLTSTSQVPELDQTDASRVLEILAGSQNKVTASFMKRQLGWTWTKAKTVLLELVANGSINAERTSYGWIFWSKKEAVPQIAK